MPPELKADDFKEAARFYEDKDTIPFIAVFLAALKLAAEAMEEREAVVKWLRTRPPTHYFTNEYEQQEPRYIGPKDAADAIERGDHRRQS